MPINFTQDRWKTTKDTYRRWWDGQLDRPLLQVSLGGLKTDRPEPPIPNYGFHTYYDESVSPEQIVDRWDYNFAQWKFVGDGFPCLFVNFGPGVAAAFMGATLTNSEPTVWFHPRTQQEIADIEFRLDEGGYWWNRLLDIYRAAEKRWGGLVQLATTDLGGNLDLLATFRPSEKLLLDLYDHPEDVIRLTWQAHETWWRCFEIINDALSANAGYSSWTPLFSEEPFYMLQCDFCYMIGPDMFDEFVKPELEASCRKLTNAFYHLDGPGQLPHLDSLLEIPELKGVQWGPGDGHPDITQWPDVYRKIHKAGKLIQIFGGQSPHGLHAVDIIADQIGSAKGIAYIGSDSIDNEDQVNRFLEKHGAA